MSTSFESLKQSQNNLDSLTKALEDSVEKTSTNTKNPYVDDRFWKPEVDKSGNGYAVIRFLPAIEGENLPWARVWSHAFQGPGGWYIENSLTTLNQKDPVSEENTRLWNSGVEADKEIARKRKRKLSYIANVYIVNDPKHPENEGQVKLYKFGKKIFDKISETLNPEFDDEKAINVFDFWKGANFKLKIRKVDGYWNYDKSEFEAPAPLSADDKILESIWKKQYPLKSFLDSSNFKSYDELKAKLEKVLLGTGSVSTAEKTNLPPKEQSTQQTIASESIDGDDTLSYFSKLAEAE